MLFRSVSQSRYSKETGKAEKSWVHTEKVFDGISARQKELNLALQKANEFLEKSTNMPKTSAVNAGIAKAEEIKAAVSDGDFVKVQKLNTELKSIASEISKLNSNKKPIDIQIKFNIDDIKKRFEEVKSTIDSSAALSTQKNTSGVIDKYTLNYIDQYKNKYTEVWRLSEQINVATGKTEQSWVHTEKTFDGIASRQKELNSSLQKANEFLEKSNNMAKTPAVNAAIAKAQEIKIAVSEGDVAKVQKLS